MITLYWPDRLWTHGGTIQRTSTKITNWRARPEGVWTDGEDFGGLGRWIANAVPANDKEQHGAFALAKINGGRCIANVECVTALGLDGDTTGITTREAFDLLEGYERIVYSTYSSTPTAQRWRAIIALSRPATGAEHYRYINLAHANLRDAGVPLDAAAVDPCRLWYLPSFRSAENYECYIGHGVPLDVDVALATVDELDAERERWIYVGDSTNDQAMFASFALSVGVANLRDFEDRLSQWPAYITRHDRGRGFIEVAERLLEARTGLTDPAR